MSHERHKNSSLLLKADHPEEGAKHLSRRAVQMVEDKPFILRDEPAAPSVRTVILFYLEGQYERYVYMCIQG